MYMLVSRIVRTALLVCAAGVLPVLAATPANAYYQHNLVADTAGVADFTDPSLINPWGIATSATSPFWVNDGGTGLSTVYSSNGTVSATKAIVPPSAAGTSPSVATGIVVGISGSFAVGPSHFSSFIFCTQDGAISGWSSAQDATHAILEIDRSSVGAVFDGLAISSGSVG